MTLAIIHNFQERAFSSVKDMVYVFFPLLYRKIYILIHIAIDTKHRTI